ncbi:glycosyltransferase [Coraliomargarita akajimensis]|uniref:Glycosyl transferase group 1 n=1 Tax=Coraliomargarita akajimensis (strain DSM 45221 / IAM 15411 / JCM 23193 / KCTC 12865 / 04OKA010-24) TaxID=583355 RepID=D5EKU4_CORAD|nr:glycosyltransferase [Coraliomargarita akajimensis]ADE55001.1 glycosyl transferase group 1 [Coraliomargarita akajimensis DSM 45221]
MSKLLLVVPTLGSYLGFLTEFAASARECGHEVHVATSFRHFHGQSIEAETSLSNGVVFHQLTFPRGASPFELVRASRQLSELVRRERPDWVQAHFSVAALVCALAKRPKWPRTSCVIQGLASTLLQGKARWLAYLGERFAIAQLDEMWVLTQDDYAVAESWNPAKARLQHAPGFGCRLDDFDRERFPAGWRESRRRELGIREEERLLIFAGRFAVFKGFHQVIRSYWKLKELGLEVRLLLVGSMDPLHESGLTDGELERLRTDPAILSPGWQKSIGEWLFISDLFVFPSEREGMPVCLMESLAMGVPVVTANTRGCRDVVRDGVDGVLLEENSERCLMDTISSLVSNPKTLREFADSALSRRDDFDRMHFVQEQLKALIS